MNEKSGSTSSNSKRGLAVVTGGSSGIGLELARRCLKEGFDILVAADRDIAKAREQLASDSHGGTAEFLQADLATRDGVDDLVEAIGDRPVEALLANAGHGLGHAFLDQSFDDARHVIDTNVTGTLDLLHRVGKSMRERGSGKILITGSIAGFIPGTYQAVYNGTKAFIDSFSWALRTELADQGISVTCLMPGVTDTEFFERADLMDTKVGASDRKMDPAKVANIGFDAMMAGDGDVVAGFKNKIQVAMANVTPAALLADQHKKMAEPGSAESKGSAAR